MPQSTAARTLRVRTALSCLGLAFAYVFAVLLALIIAWLMVGQNYFW